MAIIGNVIKKGLSLISGFEDDTDIVETQKMQLENLLYHARNTAFGKYYGFQHLLNSPDIREAFAKEVPLFEYDDIYTNWWQKQQQHYDITWPGKPDFFALTSGTTGEKKQIPVTTELVESMRKVALKQLFEVSKMNLDQKVFESEVFGISSSAKLELKNDYQQGEISGINTYNFPEWYELFFRPGKEIAFIDNWEQRTDKIAKQAADWNIGVIVGIPSWVQICLKKILEYHRIQHIDDLWPDVELFISGGVPFHSFEKSFRGFFRKNIRVLDTYLASEGFIAYGIEDESMSLKLATSVGYYYEFIPYDERGFDKFGNLLEKPEVFTIDKIENEVNYALVLSSCAGTWRYLIGDLVCFSDVKKGVFKITGRTKFWLNVVGSQLSEEKLDAALDFINEMYDLSINNYSVACLQDTDNYYHHWTLVTDTHLDSNQLAHSIDTFLQKNNKNYKVARNKTLHGIKVHLISKEDYKSWLKQHDAYGGQTKVVKVMGAKEMRSFLEYVS